MNIRDYINKEKLKALVTDRTFMIVGIITLVIIIDQLLKIWVKTHFYLGEEVEITSWFRLLFIENNGMAFGMELGSKILLTLLRIVLIILLIWYVVKIKAIQTVRLGYLVCLALIIAGASGNLIDCLFYGEIFNNPAPPEVATLFSADHYGSFFNGKVVDMLYFPLFNIDFPTWFPFFGGKHYIFFQPVFNIADSAITIGILVLVFFYSSEIASPAKLMKLDRERRLETPDSESTE